MNPCDMSLLDPAGIAPAAAMSSGAFRSAESQGFMGRERRHFPQPAYAGVERRRSLI